MHYDGSRFSFEFQENDNRMSYYILEQGKLKNWLTVQELQSFGL
jgi:hypothetical protein